MIADAGKAFTLIVETGLHAGTVQRLSPGIYTLGSELDANVVLSDPAISPLHLILEIDRHGLRLEPVHGSIRIEGESIALEPGGERYLALPLSFAIGDTKIKMTAPKDAVRAKRRVRAAAIVLGAALLAAVGLSGFGMLQSPDPRSPSNGQALAGLQSNADDEAPKGPRSREDVQAPLKAGLSQSADAASDNEPALIEKTPPLDQDQAAAELRSRLKTAALLDIEVSSQDDRILVQGVAAPDQMPAWQKERMWFDSEFGQAFMLVADVVVEDKKEPPKLAIEAVWLGDRAYLLAGGRRFHEGSAIGDGWMVERIRTGEIVFRRGDRTFSLTL